jgi:hypothetical protein
MKILSTLKSLIRFEIVLKLAVVTIFSVNSTFAADSASRIQVKNFEAPGNLESKGELGCIESNRFSNKFTPADLYKAVAVCAKQNKNKDAAILFALAGVYGRFDTLRVSDKSAHQAVTVLKMQMFSSLTPDQQSAFREVATKTLSNPDEIVSKCKIIKHLGPPNYHPSYMIQHGMGAFSESNSGNGLIKEFDSKAAWQQSLDGYLHCPS